MLQKLTYQLKLYISFALIIIVILAICGTTFYQYNSRLLKSGIEETCMDSLNLIRSRLEDQLLNMDKLLTRLHASESFTSLVMEAEGNQYFTRHPRIQEQVKRIFYSSLSTESPTSNLCYISEDYACIRTQNGKDAGFALLSSETIGKLDYVSTGLSTGEFRFFVPPRANPWSQGSNQIFSVVRPIRDTYHTYGILEYSQNADELNSLLNLSNTPECPEIILLDSNDHFLFTNIDASAQEIASLSKVRELEQESGFYYTDSNTLLCHTSSPLTGWKILLRRDLHPTVKQLSNLAKMILAFYLVGLIVLLLFLFILTRNLTRPLRVLRDSLSALEMNQDIHIDTGSSNNEITVLTIAIEDILNKMRKQGALLMETRNRAMKAHFDAMEAQLNPHFLYNTLSVIGSYGIETGNRTVTKMCTELASLLRYSVTYNNKDVLLKDELDNISSYLYIMKMRYEHMLEYTWELDDSIKQVSVPKLILQPIIENCFQHGFCDIPPVWKINIRSYSRDSRWYVAISNNGRPFEEGKKEQLYQRFQEFKDTLLKERTAADSPDKQGLGLENTVMRLFIYYKGREHFQITSQDGITTIEIGGNIHESQY